MPRAPGFAAACRAPPASIPSALLLAGGEDYELLFTVRRGAPGARALARRLGVPVTEIGRITDRPGRLRVLGGRLRPASTRGWSHFGRR